MVCGDGVGLKSEGLGSKELKSEESGWGIGVGAGGLMSGGLELKGLGSERWGFGA